MQNSKTWDNDRHNIWLLQNKTKGPIRRNMSELIQIAITYNKRYCISVYVNSSENLVHY